MNIAVGPAALHVLLALADGPRHGLAIAEDVAAVTDDAVVLGPATLYRSLKELVAAGLIRQVDPPEADPDPRRKYYALTRLGVERYREDVALLDRVAAAGKRRLARLERDGAAVPA